MWRPVLFLSSVVVVTLMVASCQDLPNGTPCEGIPSGGCPIDRGGSCDDPDCSAIYLCDNGHWHISEVCPVRTEDGGMPDGGDAGPVSVCMGGDGGTCTPVTFDTTGQTANCSPALDATQGDCPANVAEGSCAECVCLSGCLTFLLCTTPGWVEVGYCTCDGTFVSHRTQ
jgi:hypothetical protein